MKYTHLLFCFIAFYLVINIVNTSACKFVQVKDSVYVAVDKVPVHKKYRGNVQKYLAKNTEYPVDAVAKEIEGKVMVSFVITPDGKLMSPQIEVGLYKSVDVEAIRVVETMQDWKPGILNGVAVATKVTIPVHFILSADYKEIAKKLKPFYEKDTPPLFVLDKKKVIGLSSLEYYNIKSIRVLKGDKAIALYGEEGKNGVVIFETKNGTSPDYQMY